MPELVYNVRFEVDSSNLKKITSGIDPNASREVQNLNQEIQRLKDNLNKIKSPAKDATTGASAGFLDLMQNVKTTTSEVRKNTSSFKKSIVTTDQSTDSFISQSEALLDGSIQLQRLREELEEAAQQENLTDKQTEQLNNTINNLANVQRAAVSSSNNFNDGLQVIEHQAGTMNKAFSGSNQILFSFSDLVQDSTQFSQGFAQGMRAIGNNVGFTAELFANLSNNVKRHNKLVADGVLQNEKQMTTFGALKNSMKGAGGALIAINTAVMLGTLAFQMLEKRLKKVTEAADKQVEAFSEITKAFGEFDSGFDDPLGMRAREQEIAMLQEKIKEVPANFKELESGMLATGIRAAGGLNPLMLGLASLMEAFPNASFEIGALFGLIEDEAIKTAAAQEKFNDRLEELLEAKRQFDAEVANTKGLQGFLNVTKDAANTMAVLTASQMEGIQVNGESFRSRSEITAELQRQIQAQANLLNFENLSSEERAKHLSLMNQQIQLFNKLNDPVKKASEQIQDLTFSTTANVSEFAKMNRETNKQIKDLDELKLKYPELSAQIDAAKKSVTSFADAQSASLQFGRAGELAQIAGVYGEIFGASKEFRIAMATIEGASAVVSTLADPKLDTFTKIAMSATIAASAIAQIKQIKSTQLGGSANVQSPSTSQTVQAPQRGFFETDYDASEGISNKASSMIGYTPVNPEFMSSTIVFEGVLDDELLSMRVKEGNAKIEGSTNYLGD
jgi:myosin heavy subunit